MLELTDKELDILINIMYNATGVLLRSTKKNLVINRLRGRIQELKLNSFSEYIKILNENNNQEINVFINQITTNETFFFRHTVHFNYLYETILPQLEFSTKKNNNKNIRLWSAASSTGEEPYSIAVICKEYFKNKPLFSFDILASDVNSEVIVKAMEAKYTERSMRETPKSIIDKYFITTATAKSNNNLTFSPITEIKKAIKFINHNLLNTLTQKPFDVVFLRNALIYFDTESKKKVLNNIHKIINDGGYLFLGLSEGINDNEGQFKFIHSGIYRKE
ncbi:MAG: protein-glutamate O-methyltransferase CheR [Oligoflexia bacterium]|nr:protein-glutamate O-methyltransferase CheR [Oligoflexia bacterium]